MTRYSFVIRFSATQPIPDLDIPLSINFEKDDINKLISVRWIKSVIRSKVEQSSRSRLRLIYNGRVLNDKTDFKKEMFEPKFRQSTPETIEERIYVHCVIGEELTNEQLSEETQLDNKPQEVSTTPQVIGFDRLLQQGFSQEDINDLRRQFHRIYSSSLPASGGNDVTDLEEEEHRRNTIRQMEERWIESTVNGNDPASQAEPTATGSTGGSVPGTAGGETQTTPATAPVPDFEGADDNQDLLLGLLLGIFLGVVSLIFLLADDTVFNKRQKVSVFVGIFINFSCAVIRGQWI